MIIENIARLPADDSHLEHGTLVQQPRGSMDKVVIVSPNRW